MQALKQITVVAFMLRLCSWEVCGETISFGSNGGDSFTIEFVDIGLPGNSGDRDPRLPSELDGAGAVAYEYQIAKLETPCSAMNVALRDGAFPDINLPASFCSPGEIPVITSIPNIRRFVNWLNTSSGLPPAYKSVHPPFLLWEPGESGYDPDNPLRNAGARYFLPTTDEWYKAAFYDPDKAGYNDYATGSDDPPQSVPSGTEPGTAVFCTFGLGNCAPGNVPNTMVDVTQAGGLSPFGTMGQLGNGSEFEEDFFYLWAGIGICHGGCNGVEANGLAAWENRRPFMPSNGNAGFRVVSFAPEPSCGTFLLIGLGIGLSRLRKRKTDL